MDKYLGKRLDGRYEIKEIIGVGGMAYVYKAYDNIDNRVVAVKILKDEFLTNEEFTRRFKNESKAIAILSHPNIVKVYDVSFGERLQYIVMEYIDGITLKEYIDQQEDVKWKEAVHFTVQILRALQHAHDKGIVHRDIKPQNIMLLPDGTIKVADFGIARFSRQDIRATRSTDKAIGSVHYISPEQARGDITDEKADIYSVGVMLYEMLTGRLPFEAESAVSVAIMQLQSEAKAPRSINASIPEGLEEITMKAMQKDPSKRYQSAAEMLNDIDEFKKNPSIHFEYKYFIDESPTRYMETISKVKGESADGVATAEDDDAEEKKGFPIIPVLCAIAGAFLVVALVFVGIVMSDKLGGNKVDTITVPNFVGQTLDEVSSNQQYMEWFSFATPEEKFSDRPAGEILDQDIKAGMPVKKGARTIQLTVSKGPNMVRVPDVVGQYRDQAEALLRNSGFVVKLELETSEEVAENLVISLRPAQYPEMLVSGTEITMVVSSGKKPPEPVAVPSVVNLSKDQAIQQLVAAGFVVNETDITYVNNSTAPANTVISQSVTTPDTALPGSAITLEVSTGYQDVNLQIPLPDTGITSDLQIYVNGQLKETFTGLIPNIVRVKEVTLTEKTDSYLVTVKIAKTGTASAEFLDYAQYRVDGKLGVATEVYRNDGVMSRYETPVTQASPSTDVSAVG